MAETNLNLNEQLQLNKQTAQDSAQIANVPTITPWGRIDYHGKPGEEGYFRTEELNPIATQSLHDYQQSQALASRSGYQRLWDFNARRGPINQAGLGVAPTALSRSALPGLYGASDTNIRNVEDATYNRLTRLLNPQHQQQARGLRTRLANQGIGVGTRAHMDVMGNFGRQRDEQLLNAANQAVLAGRAEDSRVFQMSAAARQQEAALQNQQWTQLAGWRQQNLNEQLQSRQQEFSEVAQLLNIGNIQQPAFAPPAAPGVAPVNSLAYRAQQESNVSPGWSLAGSLIGGASLIGYGAILSDRREKTDVKQVGGVYEFRYKGDPARRRRLGVMHDEVERYAPRAAFKTADGTGYVDYGELAATMMRAA